MDLSWISDPSLQNVGRFSETAFERAGWPKEKLKEAKASWLVTLDSCGLGVGGYRGTYRDKNERGFPAFCRLLNPRWRLLERLVRSVETPQTSPQTPAASDMAFHTLPASALPASAPPSACLHAPGDLHPGEDGTIMREEERPELKGIISNM